MGDIDLTGDQAGISCPQLAPFFLSQPILSDSGSVDLKFTLLYNIYVNSQVYFPCPTSSSPILAAILTFSVTRLTTN